MLASWPMPKRSNTTRWRAMARSSRWARACGKNEIVKLMEKTLDEEKKADKLLNDIALKDINQQAMEHAA